MTRQLLEKIAKAYKVNLEHFTHVLAWTNENYTYLFVNFSTIQICGGERHFYDGKTIKMSIAAMLKRDEFPDDYETKNHQWISEIR